MGNFDMADWGCVPAPADKAWGDTLGMGRITFDKERDMLLNVFPSAPELSHVMLKIRGVGNGQWLACFDLGAVRQAWLCAMSTCLIAPHDESQYTRAVQAHQRMLDGEFVNERFQVVEFTRS